MPGWIIQGVRGEGKSLCAVAKAREYLSRGCPVATNLDLFLENLLPHDNSTIAYRLPDLPRAEDFHLLPPAYDPKYKSEDKNGLIILDELALWMNSRSWKDKGRKEIIEWLLVSRKYHWDLILLCQNHELIDKQLKTTCCDYLVQASRTDRRKIPYVGKLLETFGLSSSLPKFHIYDVYYGFAQTDLRVDQWRFSGKDLYSGYDTNQLFSHGNEIVGNQLIDFRATYTYLPASYITGRHHIDKLQDQIDSLLNITTEKTVQGETMSKSKTNKLDQNKPKMILLGVLVVGFLLWRVGFGDLKLPGKSNQPVDTSTNSVTSPTPKLAVDQYTVANPDPSSTTATNDSKGLNSPPGGSHAFIAQLFTSYRPRLSGSITGESAQGNQVITGYIEFYSGNQIVEAFKFDELHAFGVAVVLKPYGVDLVTNDGVFVVTRWPKPHQPPLPVMSNLPKSVQGAL